jgi:hypothetical protein
MRHLPRCLFAIILLAAAQNLPAQTTISAGKSSIDPHRYDKAAGQEHNAACSIGSFRVKTP